MVPTFTFFAVDKGNMTLIEFDNGINMLLDCHQSEKRPAPVEYLKTRVNKLDIVVISHPHQDHITGLRDICEHFKPQHFWSCGRYFKPDPVFEDWEYYEKLRNSRVGFCIPKVIRAGLKVQIGSSQISVLAPTSPYLEGTIDDVNNNGIVLAIVTGNSKIVLTGDTQQEQWDSIPVDQFAGTTVFLASHHGRESGFSDTVLRRMRPQRIIISDGEAADTDATSEYEKYAPVSTTRASNIVVTPQRGQAARA